MTLKEYLWEYRVTINHFSKLVDYDRCTISGYINGKHRISKRLAKLIEKVTDGCVTQEEALKSNPEKNKIRVSVKD